jgi:hypothetical protein
MGHSPHPGLGCLSDLPPNAGFAMLKSNERDETKSEGIMEQLLLVLSVAGAFLIRIGIPVILLITVGILVDRWQSHREKSEENELRKTA